MKKSKLFLVWMIAALVAGSLFMMGCEGPTGPAGPQGPGGSASAAKQAEELAAYSYTFGNPIHVQYGRDGVYANSYTGNVAHATPSLAGKVITFAYENKAATITLTASENTGNALVTKLNKAANDVGLTVTISSTGGSEYLTVAKTTPNTGKTFAIAGTNADLQAVFTTTATSTLYSAISVEPLRDEWLFPAQGGANSGASTIVSSKASQIRIGTLGIRPIPAGTTIDTSIINGVATATTLSPTTTALTDWNVTVPALSTDLLFTAKTDGAKPGFDPLSIRPVIEDNAQLAAYGYAFVVTHPTVGATAIPAAAPTAVGSLAVNGASTGAVALADLDRKIVVTYTTVGTPATPSVTQTATIFLPVVAGSSNATDLIAEINKGLVAFPVVTASYSSNVIIFTGPATAGTIAVSSEVPAITGTFANATGVTGVPPTNDTWSVEVIGAGINASDRSVTIASNIGVTPSVGTVTDTRVDSRSSASLIGASLATKIAGGGITGYTAAGTTTVTITTTGVGALTDLVVAPKPL
ncbi:hypothetical protein FACS1894190_16910 [Spirochaetia bacterium]|nr:hypothetical protein FACS1894190_16910 [Spirochaetia bacterium]